MTMNAKTFVEDYVMTVNPDGWPHARADAEMKLMDAAWPFIKQAGFCTVSYKEMRSDHGEGCRNVEVKLVLLVTPLHGAEVVTRAMDARVGCVTTTPF